MRWQLNNQVAVGGRHSLHSGRCHIDISFRLDAVAQVLWSNDSFDLDRSIATQGAYVLAGRSAMVLSIPSGLDAKLSPAGQLDERPRREPIHEDGQARASALAGPVHTAS